MGNSDYLNRAPRLKNPDKPDSFQYPLEGCSFQYPLEGCKCLYEIILAKQPQNLSLRSISS